MLFRMLIRSVWQVFHEIFIRFGNASGMMANVGKSCIYHEDDGRVIAKDIANMFNFSTNSLSMGFKYLGFHMKPNNYKIKQSDWMLEKVEKQIRGWTSKWLSSGGRFILVQVII